MWKFLVTHRSLHSLQMIICNILLDFQSYFFVFKNVCIFISTPKNTLFCNFFLHKIYCGDFYFHDVQVLNSYVVFHGTYYDFFFELFP